MVCVCVSCRINSFSPARPRVCDSGGARSARRTSTCTRHLERVEVLAASEPRYTRDTVTGTENYSVLQSTPTGYFGLNGFLETAKTLCTCEMFTQ